jgi:hypothetical protein
MMRRIEAGRCRCAHLAKQSVTIGNTDAAEPQFEPGEQRASCHTELYCIRGRFLLDRNVLES